MKGKRKINPRRQAMAIIVQAKQLTARLGHFWQPPSRMLWADNFYRLRRPEEMTENQAQAWATLIEEARLMKGYAEQLERLATANYNAIRSPARYARCGCHRITLNGAPAIEHHRDICLDDRDRWEIVQ